MQCAFCYLKMGLLSALASRLMKDVVQLTQAAARLGHYDQQLPAIQTG